MKYKIGFRLDWIEMIFILVSVFVAGIFFQSDMEDKFIYVGLLIIGALGIIIRKKIKILIRKNNTK